MTYRSRFTQVFILLIAAVIAVCVAFLWANHATSHDLERSRFAHEAYNGSLRLDTEINNFGREIALFFIEDTGNAQRRRAAEARCEVLLETIHDDIRLEVAFLEGDDEQYEDEEAEAAEIEALAYTFADLKAKVKGAEEARERGEREQMRSLAQAALAMLDHQIEPRIRAYRESEAREIIEANESAQVNAKWMWWIGVGVGLISVVTTIATGLALQLLRTVRERLDKLAAGTQELGRGNMGFRLNFQGTDELSTLAANFDRMTGQIEGLHGELDARARHIEEAYAFQKEFFAMMTHELRAPLNSILGFCELIREDATELGELAADNLQWIEVSARRMLERVNMILTLTKLEAGKLDVTIQPVALRPVLEDILQGLRAQIKTLGREIIATLDVAETTPSELRTDEEKLRHILGNLASNAAKFTEQGSVRIGVTGTDDGRVSIAVSDTGVGVSEDRLETIFELYNAGVWRGSGTGIGLALSRRFARLLGGDIAVSSRMGEGSTFTLVLGDAPRSSKEDSDGTDSDRR